MKKFFFYFIIFYPIVYSNNRLADNIDLPGSYVFSLFGFIPREVRIIESLIILLFLFIVILYSIKYNKEYIQFYIYAISIIAFIGMLGGIIGGSKLYEVFQGIMLFIGPIMIMIITMAFNYKINILEKLFKYLKIFAFINIPIALYQFLVYRGFDFVNPGDVVHGLLQNAHAYAFFMYYIVIIYIYEFIQTKKLIKLFNAFIFIIFAYIGYNEKITLFMLLVIMYILIKEIKINIIYKIAIASMVVISTYGIYESLESKYQINIEKVTEQNISYLGIVISYLRIPDVLMESPEIPIIGAGAGNYATPIAFSRYVNYNEIAPLAEKYNYETIISALPGVVKVTGAQDWTTNLLTGLIIEFGLIAFIVFATIIYKIFKSLRRITNYDYYLNIKYKSRIVMLMLAILIYNSAVTSVSGWTAPFLVYPVFFMIGVFLSMYNDNIYRINK